MSLIDKFGDDLMFLLGVETAAADDSGGARTVRLVGNAALSSSQAKFGSASIDRSSGGITVQTNYAAIDPNDGSEFVLDAQDDWTFEGWFYPTSLDDDQGIFGTESPTNGPRFSVYYVTTTSLRIIASETGVGSSNETFGGSGLTLNDWNHVVVQREKTSPSVTQFRVWINGVYKGLNAATTNFQEMNANNDPFAIGRASETGDPDFRGYYEECRLTRVARYPQLSEDISVPTAPFPPVGVAGASTILSNRNESEWLQENTQEIDNIANELNVAGVAWDGNFWFLGGRDQDGAENPRLLRSADPLGAADTWTPIEGNLIDNTVGHGIRAVEHIDYDSNFWDQVRVDLNMDAPVDTGPLTLTVMDNGADLDAAGSRYGGAGDLGMVLIDGNSDESLSFPSSILGDEFTIEMDFRPTTALGNSNGFITGQKENVLSSPYQWYFLYNENSEWLEFVAKDPTGFSTVISLPGGTTSVVPGVWYHFAIMRFFDGANYVTRSYVNGIKQLSEDVSATVDQVGQAGFSTGVGHSIFGGLPGSNVDNFRITNRAKYAPQGFDAPSAPLPVGEVMDRLLMVGGADSLFELSLDNGGAFISKTLPLGLSTDVIIDITYSMAVEMAYAITEDGKVYESADQGNSWQDLTFPTGPLSGVAVDDASGRIGLTGPANTVYWSTNGSVWNTATGITGAPTMGKIAANGNGIWCCNSVGDQVFRSTDNAQTWVQALQVPGITFQAIEFDPGDGINNVGIGFIACGFDVSNNAVVYVSSNGLDWTQWPVQNAAGAGANALAFEPEQ